MGAQTTCWVNEKMIPPTGKPEHCCLWNNSEVQLVGKAGVAEQASTKNTEAHRHTIRDKLLNHFLLFFFSFGPIQPFKLCSGFQFFQSLPGHPPHLLPHKFSSMCPPLILSSQPKNMFNFSSAQIFCLIMLPVQGGVHFLPTTWYSSRLPVIRTNRCTCLQSCPTLIHPSHWRQSELQNTNKNMSFLCLKPFNMFLSLTGSRSSSLIWHLKLCPLYF